MNLVKCPRCDLNYIKETEKYCKVCLREMKGSRTDEEIELCSVCNAAPVMPGKDVCLSCYKEMTDAASEDDCVESGTMDSSSITSASLSIDPVSDMDEIIPQLDDDNDDQISLDAMGEEENEDDEEEEEV